MATYDRPQSIWKRNLAGILDFTLASVVCVYVAATLFGSAPDAIGESVAYFKINDATFNVSGRAALLALALMVSYFVILGRTGGTVFQRIFGMKRTKYRSK